MGYLHIENLNRATQVLEFKHVYALEKIHGTSAHIAFDPEAQSAQLVDGELKTTSSGVSFFSGGEPYDKFVALFDVPTLEAKIKERFDWPVMIYGEAYGGKQQGMSATYGPNLRFVVFDIKIGTHWLDVPKAHDVALALGLEFVDYELIPTDIESLDREKNKPSTQAVRNGMGDDKMREGIVLRPPFEVMLNNGKRIIAKYKREEFSERKSTAKVLDPGKQKIIADAQNVAFEFVTPMRLEHVLNRLISERDDKSYSMQDTKKVIELMVEDVEREGEGEFTPSPAIKKAIGSQTVKLFKKKLADNLRQQIAVPPVICVIPVE